MQQSDIDMLTTRLTDLFRTDRNKYNLIIETMLDNVKIAAYKDIIKESDLANKSIIDELARVDAWYNEQVKCLEEKYKNSLYM